MRYKLKVYSIWECGQRVDSEGKPHQEDSIFPAYGQQKESDRLFILCDGMGGHEAGEVASSTVCSAMSNSIFESATDSEGDFSDDVLKKAIADAFNALDALPLGDVSAEKKMGTTMTFLKLHNKGCTIAHMGDSRVYHIRPGKGRDETKILFKTNDHSLVNDLIKVGELTPEDAKQSKQKNIITRAMQPKMERRPKPDVYHTVDIKPGDYFYMCSDGMLEQMEDENLLFNFSEATGNDENKVKILTQATSQNLDNHSAIIVHILDVIDPLPIEVVPIVPTVSKPSPIMAEVDEDSQVEDKNSEANQKEDTQMEITKTRQNEETESINHKNENVIRFNDAEKTSIGINLKEKKNLKLIIYLLLVLLVVLLALGIFFVSSKFSSKQDVKPENTEIPQKPNKDPNKKPQGDKPAQGASYQSPEKPNESTVLDNPNSDAQSNGEASSADPSILSKIRNSMPTQTNHSEENGNTGSSGHIQSVGGHNQSNTSTINLSQVTQHGEDIVSSDQQVSIDAVKKNKKK